MPLNYTKHERISLRQHPEFNEVWLHDRIKDDTSILGLGELEILKHEYIQPGGGRLDLLLAETESDVRYEVEIMLGPTDPSHIIRCIEYWDVERRRYPAYDHVAVLVAEEVTARFLNVISLLSGTIPLVAIQLNALRVGNNVVLDFVNVLDQRSLRAEVGGETEGEAADRATWENKVGVATLNICDKIASIANETANPKLELKYKKGRVVLSEPGNFFNAIRFYPKKAFAVVQVSPAERDVWMQRLDDADLEPQSQKNGRLKFRVSLDQLYEKRDVLKDLIQDVVKEHQAG